MSISQCITAELAFVDTEWRQFCSLPTPVPVYPTEGAQVCLDLSTETYYDVLLSWEPIVGATEYVVQWGLTNNFVGPTVKTRTIASPADRIELHWEDGDIRYGETYFWRVWAINRDVIPYCHSAKSKALSFTYACSIPGQSNQPPGSPNPIAPETFCTKYNVNIAIEATGTTQCCLPFNVTASVTYNCSGGLPGPTLSLVNSFWNVQSAPGQNAPQASVEPDGSLTLISPGPGTQKIKVFWCGQFSSPDGTFDCCEQQSITISCPSSRDPSETVDSTLEQELNIETRVEVEQIEPSPYGIEIEDPDFIFDPEDYLVNGSGQADTLAWDEKLVIARGPVTIWDVDVDPTPMELDPVETFDVNTCALGAGLSPFDAAQLVGQVTGFALGAVSGVPVAGNIVAMGGAQALSEVCGAGGIGGTLRVETTVNNTTTMDVRTIRLQADVEIELGYGLKREDHKITLDDTDWYELEVHYGDPFLSASGELMFPRKTIKLPFEPGVADDATLDTYECPAPPPPDPEP